jgi:hypothetical protein
MWVSGRFLDGLLLDEVGLAPAEREAVRAAVIRAATDHARLAPLQLRVPIAVLSLGFCAWMAVAGRLGWSAERSAAGWERLGVPFRALTRLQRSLALLALADDRRLRPAVARRA